MAPIFDYKGFAANGKAAKGLVEAESSKAARTKLKKQGVMVTSIDERSAAKPRSAGVPFFGGKVGVKDIAFMTRQLASLIKANIPLVEALNAMVDQTENERLKVVLAQVRQDVNEGMSLSKAVASHPKVFDGVFMNMIEAGESSGTLGLVLIKLADLKETQMRLRSKVISSMTYPSLMLGVAVVLLLAIFTFVIPKMAKIFDGMNKPMPIQTRFLLVVSSTIVDYWWLMGIGAFIALTLFRRWKVTPKGKRKWDRFKLNAPVFGPMLRMVAVTRFSSTMATLLGAGVPILTSMAIAKNLVGTGPIADAIGVARENITEGQSIAEPLKRSGEFPPLMIHMISIGEKTGELPEMLQNVAETYEEQVNTKIEGMTSLLEPLMIVGMGGAVGFIVMSVMMPLMDISNLNQR